MFFQGGRSIDMRARGPMTRKIPCVGTLNLQILAQQNPCHFLKMSEQITQGWQKQLMRNSDGLWTGVVNFQGDSRGLYFRLDSQL